MKWIFLLLVLLIPGLASAQSYNAMTYTAGSFNSAGCANGGGVCYADLAALPPVMDGTITYCKDCQKTVNCSPGGSGSIAMRQAGVWNCASVVMPFTSTTTNLFAGPGQIQIVGNSGNGSDKITGISNINGTLYADQFSGATIDAKLKAAEAACPASGCTIDASNFTGPQTWASGSTLTISKPTRLLLNGQISYTGTPLVNGLIRIDDSANGAGTDISCANGVGVLPTGPANSPGGLNPSDLLTNWWKCYIRTRPNAPLNTVNITSYSYNVASPPTVTATATTTVPFYVGQSVRVAGASDYSYNGWVVVQSVSGSTFTYHQAVINTSGVTGGTATAYMPVVRIGMSNNNIRVHDIAFAAEQNTGSVIYEGGYSVQGFSIANNKYYNNMIENTDGPGASGYGVELSSKYGLGENMNQKVVAYNNVSGIAGCFFVGQAQVVSVNLQGNSCSFSSNGPAVMFDCYQCAQNQNIAYRDNVFWWNYTPANTPTMYLGSGYEYIIENNDFEEPNPNNVGGVDDIKADQGIFVAIRNNTFLTGYVTGPTRYVINFTNTAGVNARVLDNHHSGPMTAFFNFTTCVGCGNQGFLDYENNEDSGSYGPNTVPFPIVFNYSGTGSGASYTTTSPTFVNVDTARMAPTLYPPSGYVFEVRAQFSCNNNLAGQNCCVGISDNGTNKVMTYLGGNNQTGSGSLTYTLAGDQVAHTFALQFASCGGSGTSTMQNTGVPDRPHLIVRAYPGQYAAN